jgi:hypothetical protein
MLDARFEFSVHAARDLLRVSPVQADARIMSLPVPRRVARPASRVGPSHKPSFISRPSAIRLLRCIVMEGGPSGHAAGPSHGSGPRKTGNGGFGLATPLPTRRAKRPRASLAGLRPKASGNALGTRPPWQRGSSVRCSRRTDDVRCGADMGVTVNTKRRGDSLIRATLGFSRHYAPTDGRWRCPSQRDRRKVRLFRGSGGPRSRSDNPSLRHTA